MSSVISEQPRQTLDEQVYTFGMPPAHLQGVLSRPQQHQSTTPAIVLLSAGMVHKAGPFRSYTLLARCLAQAGYPVLRFDFSGIGDSALQRSDRPLEERVYADTLDALDALQRDFGHQQFILGGLCAGAEAAFTAVNRDERICGVFMIDPHGYITQGYRWRKPIIRFLRALQARWYHCNTRPGNEMSDDNAQSIAYRHNPPQPVVQRQLQHLLQRGVALHYIYTGGCLRYYNYRRQFFHMFPLISPHRCLSVSYFSEMDHTALLHQDRHKLIQCISHWIITTFPL